jgi:hypothetical protein
MLVMIGLPVLVAAHSTRLAALSVLPPGTVAAWGMDLSGQASVPGGLSGIVDICAGNDYAIAVRDNGTIVSWGQSFWNSEPLIIHPSVTNVAAVAGLWALRKDGTVVGVGNGQVLGGGFVAVSVRSEPNLLLLEADRTVRNDFRPPPPGLDDVVEISAGAEHNLALRRDGSVVAWGNNLSGQTNVPVGLTHVVAVAAGVNHSIALKSDGTVECWGSNSYGECSPPPGLSNVIAIAADYVCSVAVTSESRVVTWGSDVYGQRRGAVGIGGVMKVAVGGYYCIALGGPMTGLPLIVEGPDDRVVPAGTTSSFRVTATGPGPLGYQWLFNETNVLTANQTAGGWLATGARFRAISRTAASAAVERVEGLTAGADTVEPRA